MYGGRGNLADVSPFSSSVWALGIELGSPGLMARAFTPEPSHWPTIISSLRNAYKHDSCFFFFLNCDVLCVPLFGVMYIHRQLSEIRVVSSTMKGHHGKAKSRDAGAPLPTRSDPGTYCAACSTDQAVISLAGIKLFQ